MFNFINQLDIKNNNEINMIEGHNKKIKSLIKKRIKKFK